VLGSIANVNFDAQSASEVVRNYRVVAAIRDEALGIDTTDQQAIGSSPASGSSPTVPNLEPEVNRFLLTPEHYVACQALLDKHEYRPPGEPTNMEVLRRQCEAAVAGEDPFGPTVFDADGNLVRSEATVALAVEPPSPEAACPDTETVDQAGDNQNQ
jgi:hypothetical protein